ncbi:MAG: tol-pal system protein YbgF [Candidatus Cloacimonetes bacterium HGW-Cloacimonetes-1]|jgi:tol-pal system protein YbgF|nr:MAG: tol-pal system protein YbgF [Candidatus Cloacimonetes bacterium HGW-Cloacimonetes-1]
MKHIICIVTTLMILSGCVSNKSFQIEQAKAQQLEQRQFQLMGQIEALRSDLQMEREALSRIHNSLSTIESTKVLPADVQDQLASMQVVVDSLEYSFERKVPLLQDNVDYIMERITGLQIEFADNNRILIDLGKKVDTVNAKLQTPKAGSTSAIEAKFAIPANEPQTVPVDVPIKIPKVAKANPPAKTKIKLDTVQTLEERSVNADSDTARLIKSYRFAKSKFDSGDFNAAKTMFADIKRAFSDDPYAANAQYWIAESYYSLSEYSQALPEFRMVVADYPTSPKAPDAMLKIGRCYEQMQDYSSARDVYKDLKMIYPGYERSALVDKLVMQLPK